MSRSVASDLLSIAPSSKDVEQLLPPVLALRGRNALQQEMQQMCLTWQLNELFDTLVDFIYFNFLLVFDDDAEERYRTESPQHPYLIGYQRLKEFNSTLLKHMATAFQFSDTVRAAMEEHSELIHVTKRRRRGLLPCEVCGGRKKPRTLVLRGRRYRMKGGWRYLKPGKNRSPEQHFVVCKFHYLLFKNYFHLRHMEWIVYWNCWQRIQVAREENRHYTSEQLINAVDPYVVKNLSNFFLDFYKQLELWSHMKSGCSPNNYFLMSSDWLRLVPLWKLIALTKRDTEKTQGQSTDGEDFEFKALGFD